jgi:mRNA interferase RelE/StbE
LKTQFKESFLKDVETLRDSAIRRHVQKVMAQVERAGKPGAIKNLKKLRGGDQYYRIRIGDYGIGFVLRKDTIVFVRCLHRKDIHRYWP